MADAAAEATAELVISILFEDVINTAALTSRVHKQCTATVHEIMRMIRRPILKSGNAVQSPKSSTAKRDFAEGHDKGCKSTQLKI